MLRCGQWHFLTTFWDNPSVSSSKVNKSKMISGLAGFFTLEDGTARFLEFLELLGPGCPETSERKYSYTLRNTLEQRRSLLLRGGNLKSRKILGNRKLLLK
jgi:hypothetical protein